MKLIQTVFVVALTCPLSSVFADNNAPQPSRYGGQYVEDSKGKKVPTFTDSNVKLPPSNTNVMQGSNATYNQNLKDQARREQEEKYLREQQARSIDAQTGGGSSYTSDTSRRSAKMECDNLMDTSTPTAAKRAMYADCMSRLNAQFPQTTQNTRSANMECDTILNPMPGAGGLTKSQMAQYAACKNGYPKGSMDEYLKPSQNDIIRGNGDVLIRSGDSYINTRTGELYISTPEGALDPKTGMIINNGQ